jgi:hypothetical protein
VRLWNPPHSFLPIDSRSERHKFSMLREIDILVLDFTAARSLCMGATSERPDVPYAVFSQYPYSMVRCLIFVAPDSRLMLVWNEMYWFPQFPSRRIS